MHNRNCCKLYFITRQYVGKTHLSSVYRVLHLLRPIGVYLVVEELSYFYPLVLWILVTVPRDLQGCSASVGNGYALSFRWSMSGNIKDRLTVKYLFCILRQNKSIVSSTTC